MKIGVILATTQKEKSQMIFDALRKHAYGNDVYCFREDQNVTYIDAALRIGLLLNSGAMDFMISGCSSGQGMMLACNSIPNVLCGYTPTKEDAWLFARINNGNCISLPLGFDFDLTETDIEEIMDAVFSEEMGNGYPKSQAERKRRDTEKLKKMRKLSQISFLDFMDQTDQETKQKLLSDQNIMQYVLQNGTDQTVKEWIGENQTH